MKKCIHNLSVFTVCVSILLFSCASGSPVSDTMESELLPQGFAEVSRQETDKPSENRMITYSASLGLSVKDTEETRIKLIEHVKINNGFIAKETENTIVARIPSENMDNYINFAKTLEKAENETKSGTDITDQYKDNILRLDNLKNVRNRYLALLEQAKTVSDILIIEKELERINLEIERLEGRIQHAEKNVAYSNITVRFRERIRPGPVGWIFYGLYNGIKWLFVWN